MFGQFVRYNGEIDQKQPPYEKMKHLAHTFSSDTGNIETLLNNLLPLYRMKFTLL